MSWQAPLPRFLGFADLITRSARLLPAKQADFVSEGWGREKIARCAVARVPLRINASSYADEAQKKGRPVNLAERLLIKLADN